MADERDQPDERPEPASQAPDVPAASPAPTDAAASGGEPVAEVPAKKAAKKAPAKKATKKAAKAAPAKKAPVKKATPAKKAPPPQPVPPPTLAAGNGSPSPGGAKEAAAQAKSTVDRAGNAVPPPVPEPLDDGSRSPVPFLVALATLVLAIMWVRRLSRDSDDAD